MKKSWKDRVEFNQNKKPACLPTSFSYPDILEKDCYISGWGSTEWQFIGIGKRKKRQVVDGYSAMLQWAKINIRPPEYCKEFYYFGADIIDGREAFCAGNEASKSLKN